MRTWRSSSCLWKRELEEQEPSGKRIDGSSAHRCSTKASSISQAVFDPSNRPLNSHQHKKELRYYPIEQSQRQSRLRTEADQGILQLLGSEVELLLWSFVVRRVGDGIRWWEICFRWRSGWEKEGATVRSSINHQPCGLAWILLACSSTLAVAVSSPCFFSRADELHHWFRTTAWTKCQVKCLLNAVSLLPPMPSGLPFHELQLPHSSPHYSECVLFHQF